MASKQGGSGADKNASRPKKLSLQDMLDGVLASESEESDCDPDVGFRDSSMDELTDTDCDDQDVAQNIFDEKRTTNDDLPLDTTVSSDSFGYITISNLS